MRTQARFLSIFGNVKRLRLLIRKLRDKYRLVILDEKTYEEKIAIRLSRLNVFVVTSMAFVVVTGLFVALVVFTPLKQYIPGYADLQLRRDLTRLYLAADSLERSLSQRQMLLDNFRQVIEGQVETAPSDSLVGPQPLVSYDLDQLTQHSSFDSMLRAQIAQENVEVRIGMASERKAFHGVVLFKPASGRLVAPFQANSRDFGIGLNCLPGEIVKATLDGSVVYVGYSLDHAWVIGLQHGQNMLSYYKQLNTPLKKMGAFVRAGDVLGVVGPASDGRPANFIFELWYNGFAIDPTEFISF